MNALRKIITQLLIILVTYLISCVKSEDRAKACGQRQSPININMREVIIVNNSLTVDYSKHYFQKTAYKLVNKGHTFELESTCESDPPTITSKIICGTYTFRQLHFHWGSENYLGSEHQINSSSYPMEMHLVHEQTANTTGNRFVVITYFFEISTDDNPALEKIVDVLLELKHTNDSVLINDFALSDLIELHPLGYISYEGSLTTKPYTESVHWLINIIPLKISKKQIEVFRKAAKGNHKMFNNYRCVQELNGRKIHLYLASKDVTKKHIQHHSKTERKKYVSILKNDIAVLTKLLKFAQ